MADDINLELKLKRCLIGINSEEGAFLSAAVASNGGSLGGRLSSSSLKKRLKQSGGGSSNDALLSALLWLSRLPASVSEAAAKVRTHYGLEVETWSQDRLTRAISDSLFVYPFYRMLNTLTRPKDEADKVFAYKYSHRGEASLTQIITNGAEASKAVSHFDEVLIQFENKVILALLMMGWALVEWGKIQCLLDIVNARLVKKCTLINRL